LEGELKPVEAAFIDNLEKLSDEKLITICLIQLKEKGYLVDKNGTLSVNMDLPLSNLEEYERLLIEVIKSYGEVAGTHDIRQLLRKFKSLTSKSFRDAIKDNLRLKGIITVEEKSSLFGLRKKEVIHVTEKGYQLLKKYAEEKNRAIDRLVKAEPDERRRIVEEYGAMAPAYFYDLDWIFTMLFMWMLFDTMFSPQMFDLAGEEFEEAPYEESEGFEEAGEFEGFEI